MTTDEFKIRERARERGFHCEMCGHRHEGRRMAFICIGCTCPATAPQAPLPDPAIVESPR